MPPQVVDRLRLDRVHARAIRGLVRVELLRDAEIPDFSVALEVQAVPVDDRVTAKDESDSLEVGEGELVESLEAIAGRHR